MTDLIFPPEQYAKRSDAELIEAIRAIKTASGQEMTILGHHYQDPAIVGLSDFIGDSFKLCRDAAQAQARHIIFCGVRFMAESARVVARPEQIVQHPEARAGCPMANMATLAQAEEAWDALSAAWPGRRIVPVAYMNSDVQIKAFCGRNGGVVCTSSNASRVFDWAYAKGDAILFLPDEHLGRNTAHARGMASESVAIWNPAAGASQANDDASLANAKLVVWKGFCHVHTHFVVDHVLQARRKHPNARVFVHPECPREVVEAADNAGSTAAMVAWVAQAAAGDTIVIGTETNLVARLALEYPKVRVLPLSYSICPNMGKITLANLLWTVENQGAVGVVEVDAEIAGHARRALEQMLEL